MLGLVLNREVPFAIGSPTTYIPTFASLRVAPPGRSSLMELWPQAGVVFDAAGNLYGTTSGDGTSTFGSVFGITP
jgi:uncharacterized repeat protein (TIGR03803 family)